MTINWVMRSLCLCLGVFALSGISLVAQTVATLRPGDVLDMRLSGMPSEFASEYSLQYTVGQDGTINVPNLSDIRAAGLTSTQLEKVIQQRLVAEKIFTRPTVIINVQQVARYVSVSGGVKNPQRLAWTPDTSLATAIGNCGGISDFGSPKGIRLIRNGQVEGTYNLKDIQIDPAKDPKLLPGDQVVVRE